MKKITELLELSPYEGVEGLSRRRSDIQIIDNQVIALDYQLFEYLNISEVEPPLLHMDLVLIILLFSSFFHQRV